MKEMVVSFKVKDVKWTKNFTQTIYKLYIHILQSCFFPNVSEPVRWIYAYIIKLALPCRTSPDVRRQRMKSLLTKNPARKVMARRLLKTGGTTARTTTTTSIRTTTTTTATTTTTTITPPTLRQQHTPAHHSFPQIFTSVSSSFSVSSSAAATTTTTRRPSLTVRTTEASMVLPTRAAPNRKKFRFKRRKGGNGANRDWYMNITCPKLYTSHWQICSKFTWYRQLSRAFTIYCSIVSLIAIS